MASPNSTKARKRLPLNPLEITSPTMFRCPISLEVMRSPVSLCTGVTYDRSSIQQWLDTGHRTCPATCQPLSSTDLVPNLTLRRLIHLWSGAPPALEAAPTSDSSEIGIISPIDTVVLHLLNESDLARSESAVGYLVALSKEEKERAVCALCENLDRSMQALLKVLKSSTNTECRVKAARLIESILASPISSSDSKFFIVKNVDLFTELVLLIREGSLSAVSAALDCMQVTIESTEKQKLRLEMIKGGVVPVLVTIIRATEAPAEVVGKAIRLLEQAMRCKEGFEEIIEDVKGVVEALVPRMMKVGRESREAAVGILWVMCFKGSNNSARDAVKAAHGLVGRLLVVMQEDCSPVVVKMAGDVLRVCTLERDKEGRLAGNYTKTLHIMPF
ncbi:U-box domain-containing protein 29 [Rhynchospora pubera]|uniref:U-box domain-containing protein n=1 Tax=Rhynchospora pubera TaxID=906938 RepID=A0AAV8CTN0_9POAL|nr:U-box domain-containing protein 29 [Rhynchospora pubera]